MKYRNKNIVINNSANKNGKINNKIDLTESMGASTLSEQQEDINHEIKKIE